MWIHSLDQKFLVNETRVIIIFLMRQVDFVKGLPGNFFEYRLCRKIEGALQGFVGGGGYIYMTRLHLPPSDF